MAMGPPQIRFERTKKKKKKKKKKKNKARVKKEKKRPRTKYRLSFFFSVCALHLCISSYLKWKRNGEQVSWLVQYIAQHSICVNVPKPYEATRMFLVSIHSLSCVPHTRVCMYHHHTIYTRYYYSYPHTYMYVSKCTLVLAYNEI